MFLTLSETQGQNKASGFGEIFDGEAENHDKMINQKR